MKAGVCEGVTSRPPRRADRGRRVDGEITTPLHVLLITQQPTAPNPIALPITLPRPPPLPPLTLPFSIMSPANSTPRKGVPSAHMPRAVGYISSSIACAHMRWAGWEVVREAGTARNTRVKNHRHVCGAGKGHVRGCKPGGDSSVQVGRGA